MATFSSSPVADAYSQPNNLLSLSGVDAAVAANQRNNLLNAGLQQDLADRQTIRDNAAGVAAGDPNATAAALGANPHMAGEFINGLAALQGADRAQAAFDMQGSANLATSVLNAPPEQRAAVWAAGRQQLAATGHSRLPPEQYPGDAAMYAARGIATTALDQLNGIAAYPSTSGQSPWSFPSGNSAAQPSTGGGQAGTQGAPSGGTSPWDGSGAGADQSSSASPPVDPGFQAGLATAESGNRPDIVNSSGYAGLYQMGAPRLQSLGLYTPGAGENTSSSKAWSANPGQQWTGTLSIPGYPQVKTLEDFKSNPAAQNAAFQQHVAALDSVITATPGAQGFDLDGLRAVGHLGGDDAIRQFVASGGRANKSDENGSTWASYYRKFSSGTPVGASQQTASQTASPAPAAPYQVASADNTMGMPATATDASPGSYSGTGPAAPAPAPAPAPVQNNLAQPSAPAQPGGPLNALTAGTLNRLANPSQVAGSAPAPSPDTVAVDPQNAGVPLPAGTTYSVGGGPTQTVGQPSGIPSGFMKVPGKAHTIMPIPGGSASSSTGVQGPASPTPAPQGQPAPFAPPAGQSGVQPGGYLVVGDSLAAGIGQANGLPSTGFVGAHQSDVMSQIANLSPNQVQGKNVVLSSGASNDQGNTGLVAQQIAALKAKGAANVTVVGVGDARFPGTNAALANIAAQSGAAFTGPVAVGRDGVHPATIAGYKGLGLNVQPAAPPAQGGGQPQPAPMSAQAAVAQASAELGASLNSMTPADANAAVQARAQQLMAGGGGQTSRPAPLPYTPAQSQSLPGGARNNLVGPSPAPAMPNALTDPSPFSAAAAAPPNALAGGGAPAPAPQPAPSPRGFDSGTAQPLLRKGVPIEYPGMAGFVLGQDANGNRGPVRAGIPKLTVTNVAGNLVATDPVTGNVVNQTYIGNTGRLTQVRNPDGSTSYITPQGQPVASAGSTLPLDLGKQDYERDQKLAADTTDDLAQLRQQEYTLRDTRDVAQNLTSTGFYGEGKAQLSSFVESTFGKPVADALKASFGLDDASHLQEFKKLTFAAASQQENANVGARGGFNLTQMYAAANPGLTSQADTIRDIINLQQVANLAHQDFAQGQINFIAQQGQAFRSNPGGGYQPSSAYAQQWANGPAPRLYLAAAEALNQQPYAAWSKGLSDPEKQQALAIASRVNNTASYQGPQGPAALTSYGASGGGQGGGSSAPVVGTIQRGFRFNGGDPSNPASWSRMQ